MANSKVVLSDGTVLIDLTADTVDSDHLLNGYTAHGKDGEEVKGLCTYDSDTSNDTAAVAEVLTGKTFHARGAALTGTMPNNGAVSGVISTKAGTYAIPQGYHDGSGKVGVSSTEQAKIIEGNIKAGIQILGVTGTYGGEEIKAGAVDAAPSFTAQTVLPTTGNDYITQVNLSAIPVVYSDNAGGGKTVTIG